MVAHRSGHGFTVTRSKPGKPESRKPYPARTPGYCGYCKRVYKAGDLVINHRKEGMIHAKCPIVNK